MTDVDSGKYFVVKIKEFDVPSDSDCEENYVEFSVLVETFQSKRFCGTTGTSTLYKFPRPFSYPGGSRVTAKFIRGGTQVTSESVKGGEEGSGFKIEMYWAEESEVASPFTDLPETSSCDIATCLT